MMILDAIGGTALTSRLSVAVAARVRPASGPRSTTTARPTTTAHHGPQSAVAARVRPGAATLAPVPPWDRPTAQPWATHRDDCRCGQAGCA